MAGGGRIQQHGPFTKLYIKQSFLFTLTLLNRAMMCTDTKPHSARRGAAFRWSSHLFYALFADSTLVPGCPSSSALLCSVPNSRVKYSTHVDVDFNVSGLPSAYQPLCACVCEIEIMFAEMGRELLDWLEINTFHYGVLCCSQLSAFVCSNSAWKHTDFKQLSCSNCPGC